MADALFTQSQQKVLGLLFAQANRQFHVNEMLRLTGAGKGALQRELARLESAGLVRVVQLGNQKRYQANREAPIYEELRGIVLKTFGLAFVLREALSPVADRVRAAFVFGSIAKGSDRADSDVDVMVISDALTYGDVLAALAPAEARIGRNVNPTIYTLEDWRKRRMEGNAFVSRVMEGAKIWLIGGMMPLDNLGNRVRIGKMKREAPDGREFLGLLHSGRVRLADARLSGLSAESRFDLAYNAAHALALAALRWHGYRSDNRYLVFQVLEFTLGFPSFVWRVLALCHERWSLAAYEGHLEVDERLLQDLLSAAGELLTRLEAMAPP